MSPLLPHPSLSAAVYSVGLYVDGPGAKKALSKYKGHSVDGLLAHQTAFDGEQLATYSN